MPDDVATLEGEPPRWPATVRDLLRAAGDAPIDRAALLEGLAGDPASDDGAAERRLAFLEAAGVFDCRDGDCTPAEYGREYLDTHDESVLFEAVAGAADGFEAAMEALVVRPLTDVEVADLLAAELDADVDAATAGRYLAWLRALGYLSREDGVNELTRKGRRIVATTDRLAPPGAQADGPAALGASDGDAPSMATPEMGGDAGDRGTETDEAVAADLEEPEAADPVESTGDADLERALRDRYDDTCMLCGERRQSGPEAGYAEVHFLMPRRDPHDGPATAENAVVVCPNHRADLEHGTVTVDPQSLTVTHAYEAEVSGRTLSTADGHDLGAQYLAYHNDVVAGK